MKFIAFLVSLMLSFYSPALAWPSHYKNGTRPFNHTRAPKSTQKYAIIDNDWTSNSFIPILMALDAGINVLGVTSSTANTWQKQSAYHALAALEIGNLTCVPVYEGATYPLVNNFERFQAWQSIHGALPWQGVFAPYNASSETSGYDPTAGSDPNRIVPSAFIEGLPNITSTTAIAKKSAAQFMVEQVHRHPGKVSIYAAGALTTVALAVRMDDKFASLAKELVIMGGYVDTNMFRATGTVLKADINTDINLMIDPEAAKIALTANFPRITIAGNVANQVMITQDFLNDIASVNNRYTEIISRTEWTVFPWWDETAMGVLVDPTLATNTSTVYVDVDIAYSSPHYGSLVVYQQALVPPNIRNVTYANTVDADRLKAMIKHSVQYPPGCPQK